MLKRNKLFQKCKFSAEEALNIIISEEYTLGTSSSDDSSSESSYSDDTSDTNSQSPSPKVKKGKKIQETTIENDMFYEHRKSHVAGVSQTHVQPTSNIPTAPEASKKSDTPATFSHIHDKCQLQHSPDTVTTYAPDTVRTDTTTQELVVSIPIHFEFENPENENFGIQTNIFLPQKPETVDQNPEEIEFPPEYFCNGQHDPTNSENGNQEDDYLIETENNQTPYPIEYPIVNCERDIDLQGDIDNGWIRVENDKVPDHCHFIGHKGLNMNTASCNPEDFFNNLFDDRMYPILAEETNKYARPQIMKVMGNTDSFNIWIIIATKNMQGWVLGKI